jgi:ADP-ribose pyrophosphatase YjhB (NUDIX family)
MEGSGSRPARAEINARTSRLADHAGLPTLVAESGRVFATRPEAVFVFLFRPDEKVLLLRQPGRSSWRTVGGAVEAGESLLEAAKRELIEELGSAVQAVFLGLAHAWTYRFDDRVRWLTDFAWVALYEGGEPLPGDDMAGSELGWFPVSGVPSLDLTVPEGVGWLLRRALIAYRSYRQEPPMAPGA